jgi:alpha-L-fucosidase 2
MLLQSHGGKLRLLPALPTTWPAGRISGLRGRGGFEVAIEWSDGRLTAASVKSVKGAGCRLVAGRRVDVFEGNSPIAVERPDLDTVAFATRAGATYHVLPGGD